jgi:hypothetical protein
MGSAVVIGGSASLGKAAAVGSDLVALGGSFEREPGSRIGGDIITNLAITTERLPRATAVPTPPLPPETNINLDYGPLGRTAAVFFQAVGLGALAMLLTAFLHPQLDRVAQAVNCSPLPRQLWLAYRIPGTARDRADGHNAHPNSPLAAVMLLVMAWLFGVVVLGRLIGERLTDAMHRTWEPVLSAGFGALVLGLVLGTSNQIPCVGWMASALIGLVGLGAAVMTLFGTRSQYRGAIEVTAAEITKATANQARRRPSSWRELMPRQAGSGSREPACYNDPPRRKVAPGRVIFLSEEQCFQERKYPIPRSTMRPRRSSN